MTPHVAPGPALLSSRVLAVVRGTEGRHTAAVLDTLAEAGIRCLEVTMNTPGAPGGPHYLRELRGPFREVPLLPTGAVRIDDADSYLKAGALAVGVGDNVATWTPCKPAFPDRTTVRSHLMNILVEIDLVGFLGG